MVDSQRIAARFELLDKFLSVLRKLSRKPIDTYLHDSVLIGSSRYYLQVAIECCLDVAAHVIAAQQFRAPRDYADTFQVLEEENIITPELGLRLKQMAKFRNRLVHLYGEIDDRVVHRIMHEDLGDLEQFKAIVLNRFA